MNNALVEEIFCLISFSILLFSILIIFVRFGIYESLLSPLNLLLGIQFITVLANSVIFFDKDLYISLQAEYFRAYIYNIDMVFLSLNALYYSVFNLSIFITLISLKYKIIDSNFRVSISYREYYLIMFVILFVFIYTIKYFLVNFNLVNFNILNILEFRQEIEHGIDVIIHKIFRIFLVGLLAWSFINWKNLKMSLKFMSILLTIILLIYALLSGSRSVIVFNILFLIFVTHSKLSTLYIIRRLYMGFVSKSLIKTFFILLFSLLIFLLYSWGVRHYKGGVVSTITQRLDYFVASYVALHELGINFNIENIIYPIISYIPRELYENKPYPVTSQVTYRIFGFHSAWSVEFGVVGESFYVMPILWTIFAGVFVGIVLKLTASIANRKYIDFYKFLILYLLYTYPMTVVLGGVLRPGTGDILYLGTLLFLISKIKQKGGKL